VRAKIGSEVNGLQSSRREELANSIISAVGLVFAVAGSIVLIARAGNYGTSRHVVSCSIYAGTLMFLYAASTLYHSIHVPRAKTILRAFDHSAIFLLIAGTYTPFALVSLRDTWGWSLFGVTWGLAAIGITFQAWLCRQPVVRVCLYVGMGWAALAVVKPLFATVAPGGLMLLLVGGLAYTAGIGFYAWRGLAYHHAIWHVFVLAGSICHFFAILFYVIPSAVERDQGIAIETDAAGIGEQGGRDEGDLLAVFTDRGMADAQFPRNLTHAETMHQQKQDLLLQVC
jgi:hemolysin III